jgi:hypothetical protein
MEELDTLMLLEFTGVLELMATLLEAGVLDTARLLTAETALDDAALDLGVLL